MSSEIILVKFTWSFLWDFLSWLKQISIKGEKKRKIKNCQDLNSYKSPDSINPRLMVVQQRRNNWLHTCNFSLEVQFDGVIMKKMVNTSYTYYFNVIFSTPLILCIFNHLWLHLTRCKSWVMILKQLRMLSISEMVRCYVAIKYERLWRI